MTDLIVPYAVEVTQDAPVVVDHTVQHLEGRHDELRGTNPGR